MSERTKAFWVLASLLLAGIGLPLLITLSGTPLDVPRNDAFAYSRVAEHFHETGSFELIGYGRMMLIGHVVWAQPFLAILGDRELAGNVAGVVASAIAMTAYFFLARRFVELHVAVLVVAIYLVFQGVAVNVATFMTEPTSLALDALALLTAVLALERRGRSARTLVVAAVAFSVASFSVREFAVALLLAIISVIAYSRSDLRRTSLLAGGVGVLVCAALYLWHSRLPGLEPTQLELRSGGIYWTASGFVTLGLGLLPLTLGRAPRLLLSRCKRLPLVVGGGLGTAIALVALAQPDYPWRGRNALADDVYERWGASGQSLAVGHRPELLPSWAWLTLQGLGVVGAISLGVVAAAYVLQRKRPVPPTILLMEVSALAFLAMVATFGLLGPLFNDRYLWPIAPVVAILAARVTVPPGDVRAGRLRLQEKGARILSSFALVALALVAAIYLQDSAAYDGARWRAGEQLAASSGSATAVDAGLEWAGAHGSTARDFEGHRGRPITSEDPYWEGFWPPAVRCFVVSNERLDPHRYLVVGTRRYRTLLWTTERTLWQLRRLNLRGCARPGG